MGIFGKLFKGPEIDQAKSADSKQKMRRLFDSVVPDGGQYQLVAAYTEDAKRFNYGLVHGSKTTYGSRRGPELWARPPPWGPPPPSSPRSGCRR